MVDKQLVAWPFGPVAEEVVCIYVLVYLVTAHLGGRVVIFCMCFTVTLTVTFPPLISNFGS